MTQSPGRHHPFAAFGVPNYRLFVGGFVCSSATLQMLAVAVGWEIYERTGDALLLGLAGLARALPVIALAMFAGHLADVLDRKKMLIVTQFGFALAAGLLAVASSGGAPLWVLYAMLGLMGCARAFNGPSRNSLFPLLVPASLFQNAVTWNANVFQFSAILGPLLAGGVIAATGEAWPVYVMTSAGTAIMGFTVCFTRPAPQSRRLMGNPVEGFFEGARHMWRDRVLWGAISLDMFAVLLGGATALLPLFARDTLGAGPVGLGLLRSAPYAGALVMGLVLAHRPAFRRAGPTLLWCVAGFGACMIVFGYSTSLWLSVIALAAGGAFDQVSVVIRHVLVQARTPDHLRGRVSAVNAMFIECSNEMGGFESGVVARWMGPVFSVVSGGVGTILVALGTGRWVPELRRLRRLDEHEARDHESPTSEPSGVIGDEAARAGVEPPDAEGTGLERGSGAR